MSIPRVSRRHFQRGPGRMQADPAERWRHSGRRRRANAAEPPPKAEGTVLQAPVTIQDTEGRGLAEIGLYTRPDGTTVSRLRLFTVQGNTAVTVYGDVGGGVVGVHGPSSDRAAMVMHADEQGGLLQLRDHAGNTVVELPADLLALQQPEIPRPWWKFWVK